MSTPHTPSDIGRSAAADLAVIQAEQARVRAIAAAGRRELADAVAFLDHLRQVAEVYLVHFRRHR